MNKTIKVPLIDYSIHIMKTATDKDIQFEARSADELATIKHLWKKLNQQHMERSVYHKAHFRSFSFEKRVEQFSGCDELRVFCATIAKIPHAYCICSITKGAGEIDSLFVDIPLRGHGIGSKLMDMALDWLMKNRVSSVSVAVAHGNEEALPFYHRFGFREKLILLTRENYQFEKNST